MNKFRSFLGRILSETCLKMNYFCSKFSKRDRPQTPLPPAAGVSPDPAPIGITDWCRWLAIFGQNETYTLYFLSPPPCCVHSIFFFLFFRFFVLFFTFFSLYSIWIQLSCEKMVLYAPVLYADDTCLVAHASTVLMSLNCAWTTNSKRLGYGCLQINWLLMQQKLIHW